MIKNTMKKKDAAGAVLAGVILLLLILSVLVPALINRNQIESRQTLSENRHSVGLHLAEVGQDRGAWKLRESDSVWDTLLVGNRITGYNFDVIYTDVEGGQYKIEMSSGPESGQVTVLSVAISDNDTRARAIRAIYSQGTTLGAMSANGAIEYRPNLMVHWGPVVTYTSIDQSPTQYYPRKYSAGQIIGRDTVNDSQNGAMPGDDWVTYDYASFYDLGNPPTIDLNAYRDAARASTVDPLKKGTGGGTASHETSGGFDSGYYTESVRIRPPIGGADYSFTCPTCVIFVEGDVVSFPNGAWLDVEALVATGNVDFNAGSTVYNATIPGAARNDYQHPTGAAFWTAQGWNNGDVVPIANVGMHGFLYAGGDVTNAGGGAIVVGAIFTGNDITTNTMTVYYDEAVGFGIRFSDSTVVRISWDVETASW